MARIAADVLDRPGTFRAVVALCVLLFGLTNLPWRLDDDDQAKQAFTSFEIVKEGHLFYQRTPRDRVATKPPLVGVISAAIYGATRSWEVAWRLPSFAAALALLLVLAREARQAYGLAAGLLAGAAFGLNLLTVRLATLVRTDLPLALVVALIGLLIWKKVRAGENWTRRDRLWLFLLLSAGMLIKGPIVYAFLLPGLLAFYCLKGANAWSGWWPWLASLGVFLVWVAGGVLFVPRFYEQVVLREFAGRFSETVHRPQPLLFYFAHLLHKFGPWTLLAIVLAWLRRDRLKRPDVLWLLCWAVGGLVVMSLVPSKRVDRIFPVVPPLCLFVGALQIRKWSLPAIVVAALFSSGYTAQRVAIAYRENRAGLANFCRAAAQQNPRIEAVRGRDEGVLLYVQRPRFLWREEAIQKWNEHAVDALIVPDEAMPAIETQIDGAEVKTSGGYTLLKRR